MSPKARVGNLLVHSNENGSYEELPSNSIRATVVESVIHKALCLLETARGRDSLVDIATSLVKARNDEDPPIPHLYKRPLAEMPQCIDGFLSKIRGDFPYVLLRITQGEAAALKKNWGTDMAKYDPKTAVELLISRVVVDNMINASQQPERIAGDSYEMFRFQLIISVAHEITHFLTGFLTGKERPLTPKAVGLEGYNTRKIGEAGRYWESTLLGGVVEFYQNHSDPLAERQAGTPYLIDDGLPRSPARQISMKYIHDFLRGSKYIIHYQCITPS